MPDMELTEDDVVTIRKVLVRDIIFGLHKALIRKGNIYLELEGFQKDVKAAIDRLYEIVNEAIS